MAKRIKGKPLFKLVVTDTGEFIVTDLNDKKLKPLTAKQLGEGLIKYPPKKAIFSSKPSITILKSNPEWVQILGEWYWM